MPTLPFEPEPLAQLQARLPEAIRRTWDYSGDEIDLSDRPGLHRAHVFDTNVGVRFIISVDQDLGNPRPLREVLHISISIGDEEELKRSARRYHRDTRQVIIEAIKEITGVWEQPAHHQASEGGVVHLFWPRRIAEKLRKRLQEAS